MRGKCAKACWCLVIMLATAGPAVAQTGQAVLVGDWQGALRLPGGELRVVLHITRTPEGGLAATLDSPDQGSFGIQAGTVRFRGDTLTVKVPRIAARFEGVLEGDTLLAGTWSQGGAQLPLELRPVAEGQATAPPRPQEPEPPYPYMVTDVTFENGEAGITLAGTLTLPTGQGPFPAVALVSGSGPQDRDETVAGHKPFLVLADYLTRHGIGVLRFDDRGTGESGGDFSEAVGADFAGDALAAVRYLEGRPEVAPGAVGLIGHSEGGMIAPIAAAQSDAVDFLVLLAAPGISGAELLPLQAREILHAQGAPQPVIDREERTLPRVVELLESASDSVGLAAGLREVFEAHLEAVDPAQRAAAGLDDPERRSEWIEARVGVYTAPWWRAFITHDPVPALRALDVPVLALTGARDLQVPPDANLPRIRMALEASASPSATVRELPGLNHLFQHAETGSPTEYAGIEETFAPEALDIIAEWILEITATLDG